MSRCVRREAEAVCVAGGGPNPVMSCTTCLPGAGRAYVTCFRRAPRVSPGGCQHANGNVMDFHVSRSLVVSPPRNASSRRTPSNTAGLSTNSGCCIACHAVIKTMLDYDQTKMTGFDARFSSPVFPGETQVVEMWRDGNVISFRVTLKERGVVSINNGKCTIAE